jgi:hypothetical protein
MKTLLTSVMAMFVWLLFVPPIPVPAQIGDIYVVCRKFVAERNCYKCSDYFHVRSEDEAKKKCGKKGYSEANYFGSMRSLQRWILPNCTCDNDEDD